MSKKLTKKQLANIKKLGTEYIEKYNLLFTDIKNYKDQLDAIQHKLDLTMGDFATLKVEENKMYEDISNEYAIGLEELRETMMEIFEYEEEKNITK